MRIYGNEELLKLIIKIDDLKEKFVDELTLLNNEYTPVFAAIKKERNYKLYIMGWMISGLVILGFSLIIKAITNPYLASLISGIAIFLFFMSLIKVLKVQKKYKLLNQEWSTKHQKICIFKDEAIALIEKAKDEVIKVIAYTNNFEQIEEKKKMLSSTGYKIYYEGLLEKTLADIYSDIGKQATSEDILKYYLEWGKKITESGAYDHQQFLESRKQKANLLTRDKNEGSR